MGGDRAFFSDSKHGFQIWKTEQQKIQPGTGSVCTAEVNIPADGSYVIQFRCDSALTVEFGDVLYDSRLFPMMHNEMLEISLELKKGNAKLQVRLSNPTDHETDGTFTARLLDEAGNILAPEKVLPLPELEADNPQTGEPDLSSYTPGTGKAFRSFGRFGFTKGDGLLDSSMPSFGIVARPFISGHPQYHKNLIWNFSLLPDGEKPSGALSSAYHVPENETVTNDWSGVRWTRRLKNGGKITFDSMMQDGKALQSGTSHFLGQNFAKAFEVTYLNKENKPEYVWATSWGVSTRLIGALIMTHSDDNGLVLPPRLAPIQVVIIPIATKPEQAEMVNREIVPIIDQLRQKGISVKFDNSDNKRPGFKFADYELKGVPVRLVIGARDLEQGSIEVMRRDTLEKETRPIEGIVEYVEQLLEDIQKNIFEKARRHRDAHVYTCENYEEFKEKVKDGGFFLCHWDGTAETEAQIKEETQATIRCVPFAYEQTPGTDMVSGKPAKYRVIIARSY